MRRLFVCMLTLILASLFVMPVAADYFNVRTALDEPGIDHNTLAKLMKNGKLMIVREDNRGRLQMITSGVLINAPVEQVYATSIDYANYSKFMPSTEECEVVADNGNVKDVRYKISFKFLFFKFKVEYVLRTWLKPNQEVTWNLLSCEGDKIAKSIGSWRFIPIAGGSKTAAFYSIYSDISGVVPGLSSFIKKEPSYEVALNSSTCVLVLKAIKNRSENPNWVQPD